MRTRSRRPGGSALPGRAAGRRVAARSAAFLGGRLVHGRWIVAADRATTARALADAATSPDRLVRPGHMFPLRARSGGTLERRGHTEATVDLLRLAGLATGRRAQRGGRLSRPRRPCGRSRDASAASPSLPSDLVKSPVVSRKAGPAHTRRRARSAHAVVSAGTSSAAPGCIDTDTLSMQQRRSARPQPGLGDRRHAQPRIRQRHCQGGRGHSGKGGDRQFRCSTQVCPRCASSPGPRPGFHARSSVNRRSRSGPEVGAGRLLSGDRGDAAQDAQAVGVFRLGGREYVDGPAGGGDVQGLALPGLRHDVA